MIDLIDRAGLDALSVREVAAAAGVSIGTVQHHFPSKQAMLTAAMDAVTVGFQQRVATVPPDAEPAVVLERIALALLPLDEDGRTGSRVWLAFLARAAVDPELAEVHARGWAELEAVLAELLGRCRGHRRTTVSDRADAALLLASLDGLAATALVEPDRLPSGRLRRLVRRQLTLLLG